MRHRGALVIVGLFAAILRCPTAVYSQDIGSIGAFGGQGRAKGASQAIVLAVQQGISSLPPTSGQSFLYEYDPELGVYKRSEMLGTVSFRSPQTIGKSNFSVRLAGSYFKLSDTLGPIDHRFDFSTGIEPRFAQFGTKVDTTVGLVNVALNYGITDIVEAFVNIPVAVVDANAFQIRTADPQDTTDVNIASTFTREELHTAIEDGAIVRKSAAFSQPFFNEGTHVGLGRVSIGGKVLALNRSPFQLAFSTEFFFPSPNEDQFAGSESAAILPRVIAAVKLVRDIRLHVDAGYDYDFEVDELRRFTWNSGFAVPVIPGLTFDAGVGGSVFASGIEWTPKKATGTLGRSGTVSCGGLVPTDACVTALGDTTLGTNFIDFLGGFKAKVAENVVISGGVNVPLNGDGLRPAAVGTGAVEVYF